MPPLAGLLFAAGLVAAFAFYPRVRRWWRKGCDSCRITEMGGNPSSAVAHTCFPWKNPYRDRHGHVWEFGRRIDGREVR